jgi:nucleoside-diphosphate-sugar epimerase
MIAVILGCGYTGSYVARRLHARGIEVIATSRHQLDITSQFDLSFVPEGSAVLYSIPVTEPEATGRVMHALSGRAARVVYLSTTAVYGPAVEVNEATPVQPEEPSAKERVAVEQAVLAGPWSALVLRPAAIYGPGRGVHVRMQRGDYSIVGEGNNYVSRIHVADLAAHIEAALESRVTGAFPVADEEPCTTREIVEFTAELLTLSLPPSTSGENLHSSRRANRRVDGSAIRRLLGVKLQYPSYRVGIPASL